MLVDQRLAPVDKTGRILTSIRWAARSDDASEEVIGCLGVELNLRLFSIQPCLLPCRCGTEVDLILFGLIQRLLLRVLSGKRFQWPLKLGGYLVEDIGSGRGRYRGH